MGKLISLARPETSRDYAGSGADTSHRADLTPQVTLGQATYERLRALILDNSLPAGTALQEKQLAERLGVSRTPVREAVTRLVSEGLVSRSAGMTPVVRRLSSEDFVEILHIRLLLESEAAGRAAESGRKADLPDIRNRIACYINDFHAGTPPSLEEHRHVDDHLHMTLANLSGSRLLASMVHELRQKTQMFDMGRLPERFLPGCQEHLEIIDAVIAGDAARARAAMHTHIENCRDGIVGYLKRLF